MSGRTLGSQPPAITSSGVASHFSAAWLHGLPTALPALPQLLVPRGDRRRTAIVEVHETLHLPAYDVTAARGMPTATMARTLCDIVPIIRGERRNHLIDVALQRFVDDSSRDHRLQQRAGPPGSSRNSRAPRVARHQAWVSHDNLSELERRLWNVLQQAEIDGGVASSTSPWFDVCRALSTLRSPDAKLIIEADGRTWHATEQAMRTDRARDRRAIKEGWATLRFMWADVTERPLDVIDEIRAVLARRRQARPPWATAA
ncbi:MAG: DUF559 domain-containing protein [Acidimicrobiales bacterium]